MPVLFAAWLPLSHTAAHGAVHHCPLSTLTLKLNKPHSSVFPRQRAVISLDISLYLLKSWIHPLGTWVARTEDVLISPYICPFHNWLAQGFCPPTSPWCSPTRSTRRLSAATAALQSQLQHTKCVTQPLAAPYGLGLFRKANLFV